MNKKIITGLSLLLSFILIITSLLLFISSQQKINRSERNIDVTTIDLYSFDELKDYILNKPSKPNYVFYLIPISAFLGLFVGILTYYIMSEKIYKTELKIKSKNKIILNLLSNTEKKIIEKILENDGRIRQYELTYIEGLSKIKVHRIIQNLEDNNIIKKEKLGKVNNIVLNKELYYLLKE